MSYNIGGFNPYQNGLSANAMNGAPPVNIALLTASITGAFTWGGNFVFTDAGTYTSPDAFGHINIEVCDQHGGSVLVSITSAAGTGTISTASLNQTDDYTIKATVTSNLGAIADGAVLIPNLQTTGALANWSYSFTTTQK